MMMQKTLKNKITSDPRKYIPVDVCLIEKDIVQVEEVLKSLRTSGYSYDYYPDFTSALFGLELKKYGVLLLHINNSDALEKLDNIMPMLRNNAREDLRDLPIVIITEDKGNEAFLESMSIGASAYFSIPYRIEDLMKFIDESVDKKAKQSIFAVTDVNNTDVVHATKGATQSNKNRLQQTTNTRERVVPETIVVKRDAAVQVSRELISRVSTGIAAACIDAWHMLKQHLLSLDYAALQSTVGRALKRRPMLYMCVTLVGMGLLYAMTLEKESMVVQTTTVVRGDIYTAINISGHIASEQEVALGPEVSGSIKSIDVEKGAWVKKGKILITLDGEDDLLSLGKKEAQLNSMQSRIDKSKNIIERMSRLYSVGGIAKNEIDIERDKYEVLVYERDQLSKELESARIKVDKSFIVAPFDGEVTSITLKEGEWATPAMALIGISNTKSPLIKVKLDASDLSLVAVGQAAVVTSDSLPEEEWQVRVDSISPSVDSEKGTNTLETILKFTQAPPDLKYGLQVDVEIKANYKHDILKTVYSALVVKDKANYVATIKQGKLHHIPVEIGSESITHVEIVSGVNEGDVLVLPTKEEIAEGSLVKIK